MFYSVYVFKYFNGILNSSESKKNTDRADSMYKSRNVFYFTYILFVVTSNAMHLICTLFTYIIMLLYLKWICHTF